MNQNKEKKPITGGIDPLKKLPDFLETLAGKILQPYSGQTHGCIADSEVAVTIKGEPDMFYGVNKSLVLWRN